MLGELQIRSAARDSSSNYHNLHLEFRILVMTEFGAVSHLLGRSRGINDSSYSTLLPDALTHLGQGDHVLETATSPLLMDYSVFVISTAGRLENTFRGLLRHLEPHDRRRV